MRKGIHNYEPWPELPYEDFVSTAYLLHMCVQAIGKLKLLTPFEPEWANVALAVTSRGLTSGMIPYQGGTFTVGVDLIAQQIICVTSWGSNNGFALGSMSVAQLTKKLFDTLHKIGVEITVNPKPQEVANPILFHEDIEIRAYDSLLANAWWRILVSTQCVLERYHAKFFGKTPPIGFMWGTFDLRDARYYGPKLKPSAPNNGYLRRNAMDQAQVEAGWWHGNDMYKRPAFYSFTYPQPKGIENSKIQPASARWESLLYEFILDYDDLRKSKTPNEDLLAFFESAYEAGAKLAGWDLNLMGTGMPE